MTKSRRRKTVLTVDVGPDQPARFFRLIVGGRESDDNVREEVLVPDGDKLKATHRYETPPEAA